MSTNLTEYQDRFWNYENPFGIETDEFELLVEKRNNIDLINAIVQSHSQRKSTNLLKNKTKLNFLMIKKL